MLSASPAPFEARLTTTAASLELASWADAAADWANRRRPVVGLLTAILLCSWVAGFVITRETANAWGLDFHVYWDATRRWLDGGTFYESWQLAGPYDLEVGGRLAVLMPPSFILIAAPFALLPGDVAARLWVVVPVLATAIALVRMRPSVWAWPLIALLIAYPWTGLLVATGNPTVALTAVLAVGLATSHRWLTALVLLKPSLAPFALFGIRDRSWWLLVLAMAAGGLVLGGLWLDWLRVVANAHGASWLYSLPHVPVMAIPVVAWLASEKRRTVAVATGGRTPPDTSAGSAVATSEA